MSKYIKNLLVKDLQSRLTGVNDALLVDVIGLNSSKTYMLRKELREKNLSMLVVNNSLAKRASEGTPLANAFEGSRGSLALIWGAEDFISLAKELNALARSGKYDKLQPRGGVMDGEKLTPERVKEIAKWPNRLQQLSILMGQILSPGASLLSQINSPGGLLLSQIDKKAEGGGEEEGASSDGNPDGTAPAETASVQSAGTPVQSAGTPVQSAGTPVQSAGTPVQPVGTPAESAGTPVESAGTPVESTGAPDSSPEAQT